MAARAAAAVAAEWWQEDDEVLLAELHASLEAGRHTAARKSYAVQRAPPRTRRHRVRVAKAAARLEVERAVGAARLARVAARPLEQAGAVAAGGVAESARALQA